jgi:hypothetical protein
VILGKLWAADAGLVKPILNGSAALLTGRAGPDGIEPGNVELGGVTQLTVPRADESRQIVSNRIEFNPGANMTREFESKSR